MRNVRNHVFLGESQFSAKQEINESIHRVSKHVCWLSRCGWKVQAGRTKIMKIQDPNAALIFLTALGVQGEIEILCLCCHTIRDLNGSKVSRHGHENPATREGTDSKIHKDPIVYRQTMQDQLQHCSGTSSAGGMTSRKDSCRWDQLELWIHRPDHIASAGGYVLRRATT